MNLDLAKDRLISHAITNYLLAAYQGRFAQLNVFSQLSHPAFALEELIRTQQALAKITAWNKQIFEDECLFSASWTTPETFEAQAALDLLEALKPDLSQLATELVRIIGLPQIPVADELMFLIAAHARHSYSKDSYVRGFIDYGEHFSLTPMSQKYELLLGDGEFETRRTQELIAEYMRVREEPAKKSSVFLPMLFQSTVSLSAIFRCHIHDVNQLLSQFKGGLNFQTAEFSRAEADLWQDAGIGPSQAGYWRAHGIVPDEAREWREVNVLEPMLAVEWRKGNFTPKTAKEWVDAQMTPPYAFMWRQAGFNAERALDSIKRGVTEPPKALPDSQTE